MIKVSDKYPTNNEMKLVISVAPVDDDYISPYVLSSCFERAYGNAAADTVFHVHYGYGRGFRSDRKHIKKDNLFVITADNTVIRYLVNTCKLNSAKIMQKYRLPKGSKYIYIGGAAASGGTHFEIGDNARNVFDKLTPLKPKTVEIFKISADYCMPLGKTFNDSDADIDDYLIKCSKDQSTFYDEYMRFMPYEVSDVAPDGTVLGSACDIRDNLAKNAHMVNDPFWYSQMLTWQKPHLWDYADYVFFEEGPDKPNAFGTVDEL